MFSPKCYIGKQLWSFWQKHIEVHTVFLSIYYMCPCVVSEAEDSNETPSSEEDQDLLDFNPDIKQSISSSRKTISQIIKDKKKQTQLTLQW